MSSGIAKYPSAWQDGGVNNSQRTGLIYPGACDAVLLLSFGGPRRSADILPFLENVTRGKRVPPERLADVAKHYELHGGRTPINEQAEAMVACLRAELARRHIVDLPIYLGNRNWTPYLVDSLRAAYDDGHRSIFVIATSAYSSYSGCRQYRENLAAAVAELAAEGKKIQVEKSEHYWSTPGFIAAHVDAVRRGLDSVNQHARQHVAFVTHSIPVAMAEQSGPTGNAYINQHREVAQRVMTQIAAPQVSWDVVFCSRSGPPTMPWTEPDINDHLQAISGDHDAVVVSPIGFLSDHMEVIHDLDTEAAQTAKQAGLAFVRSDTPLTHPAFVAELADLVQHHKARRCEVDCCPNLRSPGVPAACGKE